MRKRKYISFIKDNVYRIKIIKKNSAVDYDKYLKIHIRVKANFERQHLFLINITMYMMKKINYGNRIMLLNL